MPEAVQLHFLGIGPGRPGRGRRQAAGEGPGADRAGRGRAFVPGISWRGRTRWPAPTARSGMSARRVWRGDRHAASPTVAGASAAASAPRRRWATCGPISFDFGNTLVPVPRAELRRVVETMADHVIAQSGPFDRDAFLAVWGEERDRQFAEEVPELREADLDRRMARVLARMRGYQGPAVGTRWDDDAGADVVHGRGSRRWRSRSTAEPSWSSIPVPPEVRPMLARMAERYRLGVLSNWPLAVTIERFCRGGGLERLPGRGRRLAARGHDQAGSADLRCHGSRARRTAGRDSPRR